MAPHRPRNLAVRVTQVTGALLAGVVLSSCGQPANQAAGTQSQGHVPTAKDVRTHSHKSAGQSTAPPKTSPRVGPEAADSTARNSAPAPEQSGSTAEQNSGKAAASGGQASADRCHTSMLAGSVQSLEPAAGNRYAELILQNVSGETCDLYGYGGMQLVDPAGNPLPTHVTRTPTPGPTLIQLSPGESASASLHWSVIPHEGEPVEGPCEPSPAGADVIPPDETDPLPVAWPNDTPVCGFGAIDGSAYHQ